MCPSELYPRHVSMQPFWVIKGGNTWWIAASCWGPCGHHLRKLILALVAGEQKGLSSCCGSWFKPRSLWQKLISLFPNISKDPCGWGSGLRQGTVGEMETKPNFLQTWSGTGRRENTSAGALPLFLPVWVPGSAPSSHGADVSFRQPMSTSVQPFALSDFSVIQPRTTTSYISVDFM